jgi:hypothetical protein
MAITSSFGRRFHEEQCCPHLPFAFCEFESALLLAEPFLVCDRLFADKKAGFDEAGALQSPGKVTISSTRSDSSAPTG